MKRVMKWYFEVLKPPYKSKDIPIVVITGLILLAIPVVVFFANQQRNINSNAAGLSAVEAESGTVAGNVSEVTDANASGGKYVRLGSATAANVLINGSFETTGVAWSSPWDLHFNGTGAGTIIQDTSTKTDGLASALINVTQFVNNWDVQLGQPVSLTAGQTYTLSFSAKATNNRSINVALQQSTDPYTVYFVQDVALTSSWQQFSYSYTSTVTDANALIWFNVAQTNGQVWLDNVSLSTNAGTPTPAPTSVSGGRNFYVDNVLGVDTNNGTSESNPWKTISKVNSMTFTAGDTINFKRGSTWNQKLLVKNNGAQGNPITYKSYGTGTAPTLDIATGDGIDVSGNWNVVKDFLLRNLSHYAIYVHADNNVVSDNEITASGIGVWTTGNNNIVTRNNAHDLKMIVNTVGGDDDYGAAGYQLNNAHNTEISYNKCTNCKAPSFDYGTDGGFVEVWQSATNNRIHHNVADNTNGFFEIGGDSATQTVSNNTVSYNVAINTGAILVVHDSGTFSITPSNIVYDNNTFSGANTIWFASNTPTSGKLTFRNNIVQGSAVPTNGNFTRSNNLYSTQPAYSLGTGEKVGNPLFVNSAAKDFHLQSGSPAINAGINLGYTKDFDDRTVPNGVPDIGAFEF